MRRLLAFLLLAPLLAHAGDWDVISAPYLRTCGPNVHVWWYERDAYSSYRWPGVSCTGTDCLPSTAYASTVLPILSAANPASAAASAIDAAVAFRCDAVMTEQTPRGALCRERSQFARAHLKDIGYVSWTTWAKVADEGGTFMLDAPNEVRMGNAGAWRQAPFPAGGPYICAVGMSPFWDDMAPGSPKTCEAVTYVDPQEPTCTAPPTHRVKPNPGQTTRPVYAVVAGVRSTTATANVRATVGVACDAKVQFPSGADAYMAYAPDFAADRVTLCSSKQ